MSTTTEPRDWRAVLNENGQATRDFLVTGRTLVLDQPDRSRIIANLCVRLLLGNRSPYFSATCDVYEAHGTWSGAAQQRNGRAFDRGGAAHSMILSAFPGAAGFVRMHLADVDGTPMHAEENGRYFLSGQWESHNREHYGPVYAARAGDGVTAAANLMRCERGDLPDELVRAYADRRPWEDREHEMWRSFVEAQRPRWCREARAALALLELMPDLYELRGYDLYGEPVDRVALPTWLTGRRPTTVDV